MKVCVYGAGAIGSHLAARLVRGGAHVSVIARGEQLAAIRDNGLKIVTPAETFAVAVTATDDPARLGRQDYVIVSVKAPALPSVAARIGPLLGSETPVIFATNGIPWWYFHAHGGPSDGEPIGRLDPDDSLRREIGFQRAVGCVVYSACTVVEPGVIHVEHASNRFVLGEPDGTTSPRVAGLARILVDGGLRIDITDRIRDAVWSKLLLNLSLGPLGVLSGSPPASFLLEQPCAAAVRAVVAEVSAIAAAMGCPVAADADRLIRGVATSSHKTSILQDLELGRPMEIDALYTVPLQMARDKGVATPVLDLLAALTRTRAKAAGLYERSVVV